LVGIPSSLVREKTFSQKMNEAELIHEIEDEEAQKRIRHDPTALVKQGEASATIPRESQYPFGSRTRGHGRDCWEASKHWWSQNIPLDKWPTIFCRQSQTGSKTLDIYSILL
jgi:hypothetical protein